MNLPVPVGATDGGYTLVVTYTDQKTGKTDIVQKNLTITGIKAALTVQTAKPTYLSTEGITALSNIINSGTLLEGGNLHLQVSTATGIQRQRTWTTQADFQEGVRDNVDTLGVNDWLVPDDDFDGPVLDAEKWVTYGGPVTIQSGKVLVDSTTTQADMESKWSLAGDFDVQVDFSSNNSYGSQGASFAVVSSNYRFYVKNSAQNGYEVDAFINGNWAGWRVVGPYAASGRIRITKTGTTITGYYLSGTQWVQILSVTRSQFAENAKVLFDIWRGLNRPSSAMFDNFKVSSGRVSTKNESVDSVRLLRRDDNFDDGTLNADRWSVRSSGSATINEANGTLVTKDVQTGVQSYASVAGRFPLAGDFDVSIDWKTPVAPASGDWSSIFQISEVDQNTVPDNNLAGNALQIKRAYINGLGHVYQTGRYNGNNWDTWSGPVTTTDTTGKFRIKRVGSSVTVWYWNNSLSRWEWNGITAGYSWSSVWTSPSFVQIGMPNDLPNNPAAETDWNNFKVGSGGSYLSQGTVRLKQDAGQTSNWQTIYWTSTEPVGTSIKFRTRTAGSEPDLANASWSDYVTSGSLITSPKGRWIELEATLATTNASVTPLLKDVTVDYGSSQGDLLWQTDIPLNLAQGAVSDFTNSVGTLGNAGKYYLHGVMTSGTGQTVATYEYPFFVAQGNTALSVSPDKRVYKPGETVTISGEVKNLSTVTASNLSFALKSKVSGGTEQTIYTETFDIPAGGSHPFTVTTMTGTEGTATLTGTVTQGTATLAQTADQFDVSAPQVTSTVTLPDVAGTDPFTVNVELRNDGKTEAVVSLTPSITSQAETVTIPAGQKRLFQYVQQISADASYTFTFAGDLNQAIAKSVKYGLAGNMAVAPQAVYVEGKVAIPVTITNNGLLDSPYNVAYQVLQGGVAVNQQSISYFVTKGANNADTLTFDLAEGSYQITAQSSQPVATATASFQVRKESKVDFAQTVGGQAGGFLPVTVNVTNLGYNPINGAVSLSLLDSGGVSVWNSVQDVSLPFAQNPAATSFAFNVNLSAITPGNFTIKAELLDAANRQLAVQTTPFTLLGAVFDITQLPPYQTVPAGGSATMTFKVKNNGNQEGSFDLSFKADDLIDSTHTAWLKPGEEKEIPFSFTAPTDLEEKDYTSTYRLKSGGATVREGVVAYHLAGVKLAVNATLDKQIYKDGDTATLTLTVTQQDAGASPTLFARVNYAGYEEKRDFTLDGSQTLTFSVPLTRITGEKLFYGIYYQSGRSIHLNTLYIHKDDGVLTVTTDRQVYYPGQPVTLSITGSVTGELTLTGPGDFTDTFTFNGSAARSFTLPYSMTAGTYAVSCALTEPAGSVVNVSSPFDVAGIQVKVKEALLDKKNYASTDNMSLSLTVESNLDLPVTVRTWVLDPTGSSTASGSGEATLAAAAPVIVAQRAVLETTSTGIHKLVYGIYQGDLLLVSGAKAFDIGEAVLLGLGTDKTDYPEFPSPVSVKSDLYGSGEAGIEFFLDGTSIMTDHVTLAGFASHNFVVAPASLTPGPHTLKAILTSGGLTSTKETSFTYGSNLPDLTVRLSGNTVKGSSLVVTAAVSNQGKSASGATTVALYAGDWAQGEAPFAVLNVPALAPGATATLPYDWNVLGRSGDYVISAVADPANTVTEYNEVNNGTFTAGYLPKLALAVVPTGTSFPANSEVGIAVNYANLSTSSLYQDLVLRVELRTPQGSVSVLKEADIASLAPATEATDITVWNSATAAPGSYTINARLLGGGATLVADSAAFAIEPTVAVTGTVTLGSSEVRQGAPVAVAFNLSNSGNISTVGMVKALVIDAQTNVIKATAELPVDLAVNGHLAGEFSFSSQELELKSYLVTLQYLSQENLYPIASASFAVKDGTPPVLNVLSPITGTAYNSGLSISVIATDDVSGVQMVEYQVDEGAWSNLPALDAAIGSYGMAWQPTAADGGVHTIRFRAVDRAANTSIPVSVTFSFDTVAPVLTLSTLSNGAYTNNDTLNVAGTVSDDQGLDGLLINGALVPVSPDGSFSHAVILSNGANTLTAVARDLANNQTIETRTLNLDQAAPVLSISVPADNSKTANPLSQVQGTVDENASVEVRLRDDVQYADMNGTTFTATVVLDPGLNTIEITARDLASNPSTQKRTVLYDNQKPSLSVTEPGQDIRTNRSSIMVKGTAFDSLTAVGVTITMDNQILTPSVINGFFEQVVTFTEEKLYAINVTATDEVGTQVSIQRNVFYDVTPPTLTIGPVSSPTNQSSQLMTGTREEGTSVAVSCDTAVVGEVSYPTPTTWQAAVANLQEGDNSITASSTDAAGNQTSASATILFVKRAPDVTIAAAPNVLWPPNRKMVPVTLGGEAVPYGSDLQSVSISVADEYGKYLYNDLKFGDTFLLEAWRDGKDLNGRVYTVTAVATDKAGNTTTKTTTVVVPHDRAE